MNANENTMARGRRGALARVAALALAGGMLAAWSAGCAGSYEPRDSGVCNPGRTWVPPKKNDAGEWVAGYCTWSDQR